MRAIVATVLTVYGIETNEVFIWDILNLIVATVLTVHGIETIQVLEIHSEKIVATALTVYGIETLLE